MPPENVDWLPGLAMLLVGLAAGALVMWRLRAGKPPAASPAEPPAASDLAARRDALIEQLRELEDTAAKRTPEQLASERYALELQAAEVLRDLDALAPASGSPSPATRSQPSTTRPQSRKPSRLEKTPAREAAGAARPSSSVRSFVWGAGSAAAVALLIFLATRSATVREEGGSLTGNTPRPADQAAPDPEREQLQAAIERNPDDLDARLELARFALGRQDMMEVFNQTRYVLDRSPGHPRALSYQALVRLAMGQPDTALRMLKQALAADPDLLEGYIHLSLVYTQLGRPEDAKKTLDEAARRHPDRAQALRSLFAEMSARATTAAEVAPAGGDDPHASVPAPPGVEGQTTEERADKEGSDTRSVAGAVELDPALKTPPAAGSVVFVVVRPQGVTTGPPVAVKRFAAASFPLSFRIGPSDSMMGQPFPDRVRIEARADSDGDPLTRNPADPSAAVDGVKAGGGEVRLVLRR